MTILTVVDEENQNPTSILYRYGDGIRKANGRVNLVLKDRRIVTKWLFVKGHGARRSGETRHGMK
jgi:hypothetical protein